MDYLGRGADCLGVSYSLPENYLPVGEQVLSPWEISGLTDWGEATCLPGGSALSAQELHA